MSKTFEVIFKEFANSETFVMSRGLLQDYKAKAALEERERIIKLLNQVSMEYPQPSEESEVLWELEQLIKGENK